MSLFDRQIGRRIQPCDLFLDRGASQSLALEVLDDFAAIIARRILQRLAIGELLVQRPYGARLALTVGIEVDVFQIRLNDRVVSGALLSARANSVVKGRLIPGDGIHDRTEISFRPTS